MKAILIGRHAPDMGAGIEVVEQRAVTFPATAAECQPVIEGLIADARAVGAALLFQNMPGQVAVAVAELYQWHCWDDTYDASQQGTIPATPWPPHEPDTGAGGVGVVISVPGQRAGKVKRTFTLDDPLTGDEATAHMHAEAQAVARFVNPRAEVYSNEPGTITVEVDGPPMPFVFSHIEWLT